MTTEMERSLYVYGCDDIYLRERMIAVRVNE
jgi:hypothetical protein